MSAATSTLIMTGATRGIGLEAARDILRRSAATKLVILAREASGARVLPELREMSPHVSVIDTDLASKASIEAAAAELQDLLVARELPPLRGLVFNAGVHLDNATTTSADGYELTFAVNVLSTHLLLRRLHGHLNAPARIVVTVSDAHFGDLRHTGGSFPAPRWAAPEVLSQPGTYNRPATVRAGRRAYATSKLAGLHLVHEWSRRLANDIDIVAYNPSLVMGTGLARDAGGALPFMMKWIVPILAVTPLVDTPRTAGPKLADTVLGETQAPTGAYIHRTREAASSTESHDVERERALWAWMERQ